MAITQLKIRWSICQKKLARSDINLIYWIMQSYQTEFSNIPFGQQQTSPFSHFPGSLVAILWNWSRLILPGCSCSYRATTPSSPPPQPSPPWSRPRRSWRPSRGRGRSGGIPPNWGSRLRWGQTCWKLSRSAGASPGIRSCRRRFSPPTRHSRGARGSPGITSSVISFNNFMKIGL